MNKYNKAFAVAFVGFIFLCLYVVFCMPPYSMKEKSDILSQELSAFSSVGEGREKLMQIFSGEWDYVCNSGGDYDTGKKYAKRVLSDFIQDLESYKSYDLNNFEGDYRLSFIGKKDRYIITIISDLPITNQKETSLLTGLHSSCQEFDKGYLVKKILANKRPILILEEGKGDAVNQ